MPVFRIKYMPLYTSSISIGEKLYYSNFEIKLETNLSYFKFIKSRDLDINILIACFNLKE